LFVIGVGVSIGVPIGCGAYNNADLYAGQARRRQVRVQHPEVNRWADNDNGEVAYDGYKRVGRAVSVEGRQKELRIVK